jgi:hypothetical protein
MPALMNAKRDQKNGQLDEEEAEALLSLLSELLDTVDLSNTRAVAPDGAEREEPATRQRLCLLGYAVDGDLDRVALKMLQKLLDPDRWDVEVIADGTLISEVVAGVAVDPPAVICITSIPPGGIMQARYLCKKLRAVAPNLPLLVGRWGQRRIGQADRVRLIEAGANYLATTLVETRKWLDARYPVLCQAPAKSTTKCEQILEPTLTP